MSELAELLEGFRRHEGVEHLILLGRDGLVVQHSGGPLDQVEAVAARIPGLAASAEAVGGSSAMGTFMTGVVELEAGVAIVVALSGDLLLTVLVRAGVGFAPLLRDLRRERSRLVELL